MARISPKNKKDSIHYLVLTLISVCAILSSEVIDMRAKDIVSCVMKLRGHSCRSLAEKLKYPHPSGVSQRLRGAGDMNVAVLVKFLEAMDCELVIRSTLADKSEWTITSDNQ